MSMKRVALYVVAAALVVPTFVIATIDVHTGPNDCGTAIVTRDPSRDAVQDTTDPTAADYAAQTLRDTCAHLITRQRIGAGIPLIAIVACLVAAGRKPRHRRLPGDSVI